MLPSDSSSSFASDDCAAAGLAEPLFISVIMPVRNEAKFIERTLGQLVAQDYDAERFEVLVVDGESTDGTPDLVRQFAERHRNVSLDTNPRRLGSAARNIAVRKSRGDIVLLVDGHCELNDRQYLCKLADAFRRSGADCVGRPQPLNIEGASTLQRAIAAARSSRLGHHPDSFIYSATAGFVPAKSVAVAYRRSVFDKVGYFDETFDACEDVEFNHRVDRAGLRCYFTPEVAVHYAPRDSLRGLFRQLFRYGRGRVRLGRKHPDTISMRTFLPALFIVGCLAGLGMVWLSLYMAVLYVFGLLLYGTIVLAASAALAIGNRNIASLPWLPPVFLTIHLATGAGIILELARP